MLRFVPLIFIDPSGHCYVSPEGERICPPLPGPFPASPPNGVTDRPVGDPAGPGGQQAYDVFVTLQNEVGAWWGSDLSAEEAMMMFVNHEAGHTLYQDAEGNWHILPELLEAITRKYNQFCSGGPWTAECFNGFWSYSHPLTNVVSPHASIRAAAIKNIRTNSRYTTHLAGLRQIARQIMNNKSLGGHRDDRPSDWVNYFGSDPKSLLIMTTLWNNMRQYGTGNSENQMVFYAEPTPGGPDSPIPPTIFIVYTRSQYNNRPSP